MASISIVWCWVMLDPPGPPGSVCATWFDVGGRLYRFSRGALRPWHSASFDALKKNRMRRGRPGPGQWPRYQ